MYHPKLIENFPLINDKSRNLFFKESLEKYSKDKIVLDMGSGTGILSFYALSSGAKFVYAIEFDKNSAMITNCLLSSHFDRDRFCVLNINFWDDDLSKYIRHKIDILVSETVGPGLFDQRMLRTWYTIKNYVSDDFISIPDKLSIDVHQWNGKYEPIKDEFIEFSNFCKENVLDYRIYETLVKIDDLYCKKYNNTIKWYEQQNFSIPDKIYTDALVYSFNDIQTFESCENIEFYLDTKTDGIKTLSFMNKISFQGTDLWLRDGKCEYKYIPFFTVDGKIISFKFKYQQHNLNHLIYDSYNCWEVMSDCGT